MPARHHTFRYSLKRVRQYKLCYAWLVRMDGGQTGRLFPCNIYNVFAFLSDMRLIVCNNMIQLIVNANNVLELFVCLVIAIHNM